METWGDEGDEGRTGRKRESVWMRKGEGEGDYGSAAKVS